MARPEEVDQHAGKGRILVVRDAVRLAVPAGPDHGLALVGTEEGIRQAAEENERTVADRPDLGLEAIRRQL